MDITTIPCLFDNFSYLIVDEGSGEAAVVDPSEAWPVLQEAGRRQVHLGAVLCTHHHQDHIGGIEDLLDAYPDLRVVACAEDRGRIPRLNEPVGDGDEITVCGTTATVLHTPGHTATALAYRFESALFVGDTLFGAGCGRLFEGTPAQMVASLDRLAACPADCRIYFGHEYTATNLRFARLVDPGNEAVVERQERVGRLLEKKRWSTPSTVAEELQTNPFLRLEDEAIRARLAEDGRLQDQGRIDVFTALREMRNHFS